MKISTKSLVTTALLAALSSILFMIEIPIVMFYKLDLSNLPVLVGTFSLGPIFGFIILLIKDIIGLLHSSSGGIGELADFIVGLVFVVICGFMYSRSKNRSTALISMIISTLASTIVAVLLNKYLLIPMFIPNNGLEIVTNMAQKIFPFVNTGTKFLLFVTAPFNILKGAIISGFTSAIYKKLSYLLFKGETKHV